MHFQNNQVDADETVEVTCEEPPKKDSVALFVVLHVLQRTSAGEADASQAEEKAHGKAGQGEDCMHVTAYTKHVVYMAGLQEARRAGGPASEEEGLSVVWKDGGEPSLPCLPGRHAMDPTATAGPDVEGGVCLVSLMPWWFFCCPYQEPSSSSTSPPPPELVRGERSLPSQLNKESNTLT